MSETDANVTENNTDDTSADNGTQKQVKEESKEDTQQTHEAENEEGREPPETEGAPESYADFTLPEGYVLEAKSKDIVIELAKELGLKQEQAQKMVDKYIEASEIAEGLQTEAQKRQVEQQYNDWDTEIRKEWGLDYEKNDTLAQKTIKRFFDETELKESAFDRVPFIRRAFLNIGKLISEDTLERGMDAKPKTGSVKDMFSDLNKNNVITK